MSLAKAWIKIFALPLFVLNSVNSATVIAQENALGEPQVATTVFKVQAKDDRMILTTVQQYPAQYSLEQAKSDLTSSILPIYFGRSVRVKKIVRTRISPSVVEMVTYAEKDIFGVSFDVTTYSKCTESPVVDGWQESCILDMNRGDAKRVFVVGSSEVVCVGREAPVCVQTLDGRFKRLRFPISAKPKQLAIAGAIESLHVSGATLSFASQAGVTPQMARQAYESSFLFNLVEKMRPYFEQAKDGDLDSVNLTISGSDRDGSFSVIKN